MPFSDVALAVFVLIEAFALPDNLGFFGLLKLRGLPHVLPDFSSSGLGISQAWIGDDRVVREHIAVVLVFKIHVLSSESHFGFKQCRNVVSVDGFWYSLFIAILNLLIFFSYQGDFDGHAEVLVASHLIVQIVETKSAVLFSVEKVLNDRYQIAGEIATALF